jgi:hypothetical protein
MSRPSFPESVPDCWKCLHHFITHDPTFPYGCHAMQFKSRRLPCKEVLDASGEGCLMFQRKEAGAR